MKPQMPTTLVLGAGELGLAVIEGLMALKDRHPGLFSVLVRLPTTEAARRTIQSLRNKNIDIVHADLATNTVDDLAATFTNYDTVICCTGFVGGPGTQRKITAAVLKAEVKRYVPWQFGVDYDIIGRGSGQSVWDEQADVRDMLRGQSAINWIIISTGMFTSFLFEPAFGVVDLAKGQVNALGSWDYRLTVTTPEDIGRLTAAILAHEPQIREEVIYIAGDTFTYAQLADMVDIHLGRKIERNLWDIEHLRSEVAANPNDGIRKYHLAFARDSGVAWDKASTFNAEQSIVVTDVPTWLRQVKDAQSRA
nr:hypothetical protein B0A51_11679 [Rachicladosporium sp. CCFEE 5018]